MLVSFKLLLFKSPVFSNLTLSNNQKQYRVISIINCVNELKSQLSTGLLKSITSTLTGLIVIPTIVSINSISKSMYSFAS